MRPFHIESFIQTILKGQLVQFDFYRRVPDRSNHVPGTIYPTTDWVEQLNHAKGIVIDVSLKSNNINNLSKFSQDKISNDEIKDAEPGIFTLTTTLDLSLQMDTEITIPNEGLYNPHFVNLTIIISTIDKDSFKILPVDELISFKLEYEDNIKNLHAPMSGTSEMVGVPYGSNK